MASFCYSSRQQCIDAAIELFYIEAENCNSTTFSGIEVHIMANEWADYMLKLPYKDRHAWLIKKITSTLCA